MKIFIEIIIVAAFFVYLAYNTIKGAEERKKAKKSVRETYDVDAKRAEILKELSELSDKIPNDILQREEEKRKLMERLEKINEFKNKINK